MGKREILQMERSLKSKAILLMNISLLMLITACSSASTIREASKSGITSLEEPAEKLVIGFSQVGTESEWRMANTESIKKAIMDAGHELIYSDAQQKKKNQIKAIRSFIEQKVDVIVFSPVVETGFSFVLKEAKKAGIPVFLVDRAVDINDDSLWVTFIGSDFVEEGKKAANWLVEEMEDQEGDINIVELQGTIGSAPAIDRKEGFENILANHPNFKIINSQSGDFTRTKGKEVMEAFLKSNGENIDVLYSHNDDMAIGAIQAIEEYGLKPGKEIKIIGIDAVKDAFEVMAAGKMNVSVECNPLFGPQLVELIEAHIAGDRLEKRISVEESIYTMNQAKELISTRKY